MSLGSVSGIQQPNKITGLAKTIAPPLFARTTAPYSGGSAKPTVRLQQIDLVPPLNRGKDTNRNGVRSSRRGYKMKIRIAVLLFASTLCSTASADVYKCKSQAGNTIYSDEPCGRNAKLLSNLDANTLPAITAPVQSQQPTQPQPQRPPEEPVAPAPAKFVADPYTCNLARRNADTTASSSSADPNRVLLAEREANIACYGTAKAGEIEQARAGATKVIIRPNTQSARQPTRFITHCAGAYCFDNFGGRHPRLRP